MTVAQRHTAYPLRQRAKRTLAAKRLDARVARGIHKDAFPDNRKALTPSKIHNAAKGILYAGAALLMHGGLVAGFVFGVSPDDPYRPDPSGEKVVFRVDRPPVDPVTPPVDDAPRDAIPEPEPEPDPEPEPIRRPSPPRPPADPVDVEDAPPPEKPRRRIVGLSMSSTVKAGKGAAFAVGNTRMGKTDDTQKDVDNLETLTSTGERGTGKSDGTAQVNKAATRIPTATVRFQKPKRLKDAQPDYPPTLKSRGIEGNVVVLIVIDEAGAVTNVRVIQSSGYPEFDNAAADAARRASYAPAQRDGVSVSYNLKYTYRFRIRGA